MILPKEEYFRFGNPYSGSVTTENEVFNYLITFVKDDTDVTKFICKTWQGLLCSDKAENIVMNEFNSLDEVAQFLDKTVSAV
ncbi:hypothetical protein FACS1894132_10560 [Clostridia bacterium]|nr:hypothetical protein FACS1894132_10560 [Clostridia bacterium]